MQTTYGGERECKIASPLSSKAFAVGRERACHTLEKDEDTVAREKVGTEAARGEGGGGGGPRRRRRLHAPASTPATNRGREGGGSATREKRRRRR
jgi:hypothetical protein